MNHKIYKTNHIVLLLFHQVVRIIICHVRSSPERITFVFKKMFDVKLAFQLSVHSIETASGYTALQSIQFIQILVHNAFKSSFINCIINLRKDLPTSMRLNDVKFSEKLCFI